MLTFLRWLKIVSVVEEVLGSCLEPMPALIIYGHKTSARPVSRSMRVRGEEDRTDGLPWVRITGLPK